MSGEIIVSHVGVSYRSLLALNDITVKVKPGKLTGIIGPNGAGKSTLIKAMLGLIPINQGSVFYGNLPLYKQLDKVAYVPQRSAIDWTYPATVEDVVMMGRVKKTGWFRPFSTISRHRAFNALQKVEMREYKDRPIGQLSGGQQQRVFLARALAQEADLFFFDEPFVGVDQKTESILFNIFKELAGEGKTVVVVNHDLGESITNFDDLILLNRELVAADRRQVVLTDNNLSRAYNGKVSFYGDGYYPTAA